AGSVLLTEPAATGRGSTPPAAPTSAARLGVPVRVPERLTVEATRWHQGRLLVLFEGIYDRNLAEVLRGTLLCVDSADLAEPEDPDEYHDYQLVGLAAVTAAGERLGEVARIEHAPASDLLVLRRP